MLRLHTSLNGICMDGNEVNGKQTRSDMTSFAIILDRSWKFKSNINYGTQISVLEAAERFTSHQETSSRENHRTSCMEECMVGEQKTCRNAVKLVLELRCKVRPHSHAHIHTCLPTTLAIASLCVHTHTETRSTQKHTCVHTHAHALEGRYEARVLRRCCW